MWSQFWKERWSVEENRIRFKSRIFWIKLSSNVLFFHFDNNMHYDFKYCNQGIPESSVFTSSYQSKPWRLFCVSNCFWDGCLQLVTSLSWTSQCCNFLEILLIQSDHCFLNSCSLLLELGYSSLAFGIQAMLKISITGPRFWFVFGLDPTLIQIHTEMYSLFQ